MFEPDIFNDLTDMELSANVKDAENAIIFYQKKIDALELEQRNRQASRVPVRVVDYPTENKISLIKAVREVNEGMGLREAKDFVEAFPFEVNIPQNKAVEFITTLVLLRASFCYH